MGSRKTPKTIEEYSEFLPDGVILRRSVADHSYILSTKKRELGRRREEVVTQWEFPERVFAYLARTWLSGRKFPDEKTQEAK